MPLVRVKNTSDLVSPTVVVAMDAWVDAGAASTNAAKALADDTAPIVASFESDLLYDYRARRPMLEVIDGRPANLAWPDLLLRRVRLGERDILVLTGPEPDFRWRELADDLASLARQLEVEQWISSAQFRRLCHTRPVPVLGTESSPGLLRGDVQAGPQGLLRVPSAALSVFDLTVAEAGIPAIGYFAQIPHYISGEYAPAAIALIEAIARHLDVEIEVESLRAEAELLRARLDTATAVDEKTRSYVGRLEEMVDEARLPAGDELISEIERFLRERGSEPGHGQVH